MKNITKYTTLILIILCVACGSSTYITAVWHSPEYQNKNYHSLCIAAITENIANKQIVEQDMQDKLKLKGVHSTKIVDLVKFKFNGGINEKDLILEKARANFNDAIITFTLIKQKESTRYVPNNNMMFAPQMQFGHYRTFGGYYGFHGGQMFDPGYYTTDEIYFIESNVYDVRTESLVWSVQSKTYNPSDIKRFANEFTKAITQQLIKSKIISPIGK